MSSTLRSPTATVPPPTPGVGDGSVPAVPEGFVAQPPVIHHTNNVPMTPATEPLAPAPVVPAQAAVLPQSQVLPPQTVVLPQNQVVPAQMVVVPQNQVAPQMLATPHSNTASTSRDAPAPQELLLFSHSNLFYWWPVWAVGYLMAFITWMWGVHENLGEHTEVIIHPSKNLGVIFTLTFFLIILTTNVTVRGVSSVVVILCAIIATLTLAYLRLWDDVLGLVGRLEIFMNLGFYLFFSTAVLIVWSLSFFVYDRLTFWRIRPGQITLETVVGGAESSYDTRGMLFEKHREDLFRHWIIGMGSGDLQISTTGAKRETLSVPNVLFVNRKLHMIQKLIAMKPTELTT